MRRVTFLVVMLLVLAACSSAPERSRAKSPEATGTPAPPTYDSYVALGDSYTSAPGVPLTDVAEGCLRSNNNYPSLVSRKLKIKQFVDVSCGAARTYHLTHAQHPKVPPQLDALRPDTSLVTLGIGGNDGRVIGSIIVRCQQVSKPTAAGAPCLRIATAKGGDAFRAAVDRSGQEIRVAVAEIRRRSPHARILLVGYPQIVPAKGTCPKLLPVAAGDYPYVRKVNDWLNGSLRKAAKEIRGAEYVDVWAASEGHDLCSAQSWIQGPVNDNQKALAYHPFAAEQEAVADLIVRQLARPPEGS